MLFILYFTHAGERIAQQYLGVPKKWETIESWFDGSRGVVKPAVTEPRLPELKNPKFPFWLVMNLSQEMNFGKLSQLTILKKLATK